METMRPEFAVQTPETVPEWPENTSESLSHLLVQDFGSPAQNKRHVFKKETMEVNSVGFCGAKYPGPPQTYP